MFGFFKKRVDTEVQASIAGTQAIPLLSARGLPLSVTANRNSSSFKRRTTATSPPPPSPTARCKNKSGANDGKSGGARVRGGTGRGQGGSIVHSRGKDPRSSSDGVVDEYDDEEKTVGSSGSSRSGSSGSNRADNERVSSGETSSTTRSSERQPQQQQQCSFVMATDSMGRSLPRDSEYQNSSNNNISGGGGGGTSASRNVINSVNRQQQQQQPQQPSSRRGTSGDKRNVLPPLLTREDSGMDLSCCDDQDFFACASCDERNERGGRGCPPTTFPVNSSTGSHPANTAFCSGTTTPAVQPVAAAAAAAAGHLGCVMQPQRPLGLGRVAATTTATTVPRREPPPPPHPFSFQQPPQWISRSHPRQAMGNAAAPAVTVARHGSAMLAGLQPGDAYVGEGGSGSGGLITLSRCNSQVNQQDDVNGNNDNNNGTGSFYTPLCTDAGDGGSGGVSADGFYCDVGNTGSSLYDGFNSGTGATGAGIERSVSRINSMVSVMYNAYTPDGQDAASNQSNVNYFGADRGADGFFQRIAKTTNTNHANSLNGDGVSGTSNQNEENMNALDTQASSCMPRKESAVMTAAAYFGGCNDDIPSLVNSGNSVDAAGGAGGGKGHGEETDSYSEVGSDDGVAERSFSSGSFADGVARGCLPTQECVREGGGGGNRSATRNGGGNQSTVQRTRRNGGAGTHASPSNVRHQRLHDTTSHASMHHHRHRHHSNRAGDNKGECSDSNQPSSRGSSTEGSSRFSGSSSGSSSRSSSTSTNNSVSRGSVEALKRRAARVRATSGGSTISSSSSDGNGRCARVKYQSAGVRKSRCGAGVGGGAAALEYNLVGDHRNNSSHIPGANQHPQQRPQRQGCDIPYGNEDNDIANGEYDLGLGGPCRCATPSQPPQQPSEPIGKRQQSSFIRRQHSEVGNPTDSMPHQRQRSGSNTGGVALQPLALPTFVAQSYSGGGGGGARVVKTPSPLMVVTGPHSSYPVSPFAGSAKTKTKQQQQSGIPPPLTFKSSLDGPLSNDNYMKDYFSSTGGAGAGGGSSYENSSSYNGVHNGLTRSSSEAGGALEQPRSGRGTAASGGLYPSSPLHNVGVGMNVLHILPALQLQRATGPASAEQLVTTGALAQVAGDPAGHQRNPRRRPPPQAFKPLTVSLDHFQRIQAQQSFTNS